MFLFCWTLMILHLLNESMTSCNMQNQSFCESLALPPRNIQHSNIFYICSFEMSTLIHNFLLYLFHQPGCCMIRKHPYSLLILYHWAQCLDLSGNWCWMTKWTSEIFSLNQRKTLKKAKQTGSGRMRETVSSDLWEKMIRSCLSWALIAYSQISFFKMPF